ncbi:MAG: hypothetical protein QOF48_508 [Verrucomicrobiota bacterium]|jgi:prepilin signal peptidase PulO-like enzyme (type II secretory pathway)
MFLIQLFSIGVCAAGAASVVLSFTRLRYSWIVFLCALPAFTIGLSLTGVQIAQRLFSPELAVFCTLFFVGAFGIFRWSYKRSWKS